MRLYTKIFSLGLLIVAVVLLCGITVTIGWRPILGPRLRPLTGRHFEATPERLVRGQYLFNDVSGCIDCHTPHDWSNQEAALPSGMLGAGADLNAIAGLPGKVYAPNLTSDRETGLGQWTDDEIARAIREGVDREGRALFPMMPYAFYRAMSDEDLASLVVYLRTLPPVHNQVPRTRLNFPVKYLIRSVPEPIIAPVRSPDSSTPEQRGRYLATIAACADCHTPVDKGQPIRGLEFAGGQIYEGPWGRVASANITPDASGIAYYDQALFIEMMRTGKVHARPISRIMPWSSYRGMTDADLAAIFAFLKTLPPVHHRVDNTEAPSYCRLCRHWHGLGDQN